MHLNADLPETRQRQVGVVRKPATRVSQAFILPTKENTIVLFRDNVSAILCNSAFILMLKSRIEHVLFEVC